MKITITVRDDDKVDVRGEAGTESVSWFGLSLPDALLRVAELLGGGLQ